MKAKSNNFKSIVSIYDYISLQCFLCSAGDVSSNEHIYYILLSSKLTLDRFDVASFTRVMTLRRARPTPSMDKFLNRFIQNQRRKRTKPPLNPPRWPPLINWRSAIKMASGHGYQGVLATGKLISHSKQTT